MRGEREARVPGTPRAVAIGIATSRRSLGLSLCTVALWVVEDEVP